MTSADRRDWTVCEAVGPFVIQRRSPKGKITWQVLTCTRPHHHTGNHQFSAGYGPTHEWTFSGVPVMDAGKKVSQ